MTTSTVHYEVIGATAVLTLDNPPVNAMNRPLTTALAKALERAHDDVQVRAVVMTAAGQRAFCAGSDIKEIADLREPGTAVELKLRPQKEVFDHLAHFPKPTIAALNGLCYGGGLEIAVCCDLIVAEEQVKIASPEITLGLFPSSGGTLRTTRRVGVGRAKEIMLLAEPVNARTAFSWGLINRLAPTGEGLEVALDLAERLADRPATGTAMCKAAITLAFDAEDEALERTLSYSDRAFASVEAHTGVDSFVAKRKPDYRSYPYPARRAAAIHLRGAETPLAWLPFPIADLPKGLRYEVAEDPDAPPTRLNEIEFYVMPYRFLADDTAVLSRMPKLRVVQTQTSGVEHLSGRIPAGVTLCNGRGIHSAATAELAVALTLASLRGIPGFVRAQDRQEWAQQFHPSLADKHVLIVGFGDIGAAVEARLQPFEVTLNKVARTARGQARAITDLPTLVPRADIVILTVPLTAQTRHLVDADFLASMKDGGLLVNVARGGVVDTDALIAELRNGRISAALDVTDPEPPPPGHPLWTAPNLLLSPHIGGPTSAFQPRAERLIKQQLARFAAGQPLENVMNAPPTINPADGP